MTTAIALLVWGLVVVGRFRGEGTDMTTAIALLAWGLVVVGLFYAAPWLVWVGLVLGVVTSVAMILRGVRRWPT